MAGDGDRRSDFKPVLGFLGATGISIGGIIGSGIFFIVGIAAGVAGPAVVLSFIAAGIVAILTSLSFASLGSKITAEGGEYQFVYLTLGSEIGFFGGILWVAATAVAAVTVSLALASYLSVFFPGMPVNVAAAGACVLFMAIDVTGVKLTSATSAALVIVKTAVLILFILIGLPFVNVGNFQPLLTKGIGGALSGAFLIFFAYAGFGKVTAASEEVKNAKKTVPLAIITAISICTALYILSSFVAVGVAGADQLASSAYRVAPFSYVMRSTGVAAAFEVVTFGAIAATASVLLVQMMGLSRTLYAMSTNRQLPKFLSAVHPRFRTPYKAELIAGVAMALAALTFDVNSVVSLTSVGILAYYALINLAALRVGRQGAGTNAKGVVLSALGFASCAGLILYYFLFAH